MAITHNNRGHVEEVEGTRYRSGLEASFARFLLSEGLSFEYEERSFPYGDGRTYTPDFFVNDWGCFIEVKPACFEKSRAVQRKVAAVREAGESIEIFTEMEIRGL